MVKNIIKMWGCRHHDIKLQVHIMLCGEQIIVKDFVQPYS